VVKPTHLLERNLDRVNIDCMDVLLLEDKQQFKFEDVMTLHYNTYFSFFLWSL